MNRLQVIDSIKNIVAFDKFQENERAEDIAEFCQMVSAGIEEDEFVEELRPHENKEQKKQRARCYYSLAPYATNKIFNFISRLKSVENVVESIEGASEEQSKQLKDVFAKFYDGKPLLQYCIDKYIEYQKTDPNALMRMSHYDVMNPKTNTVDTRKIDPVFIESEKIVNITEIGSRIIDATIAEKRRVQYKEKQIGSMLMPKIAETIVTDFYYYTEGLSMVFIRSSEDFEDAREIDMPPFELTNLNFETIQIEKMDGIKFTYRVYTFETNLPCPLIRMSGRIDNIDKTICTSILMKAENQFKQLISRKSELDVTYRVHTFKQKIAISPECSYTDSDNNQCESGHCGGRVCPQCHGTGTMVHISGQDLITISIPRGATPQDIPDITKMVHYVEQSEYVINQLKSAVNDSLAVISDSIFETNIFSNAQVSANGQGQTPQNGITQTATAVLIDWQKLYISLREDAEFIEKLYSYIGMYQSALLFDNYKSFDILCKFPHDFKFQTLDDLINEFAKAKDLGLPSSVIEQILRKIIEKQSPDNLIEMNWGLFKLEFMPFSDKTENERAIILAERANDDYDKVLWENFDSIFDQLEFEQPLLFTKKYSEKQDSVRAMTDRYISEIKYNQNSANNILNQMP